MYYFFLFMSRDFHSGGKVGDQVNTIKKRQRRRNVDAEEEGCGGVTVSKTVLYLPFKPKDTRGPVFKFLT